jgi:23S rRNA (adenine2503-C2)-methyltransferase
VDCIRRFADLWGRPYRRTGPYGGSPRDAIAAFEAVLDAACIPATVRLSRGRDIAAACGQLAATR